MSLRHNNMLAACNFLHRTSPHWNSGNARERTIATDEHGAQKKSGNSRDAVATAIDNGAKVWGQNAAGSGYRRCRIRVGRFGHVRHITLHLFSEPRYAKNKDGLPEARRFRLLGN